MYLDTSTLKAAGSESWLLQVCLPVRDLDLSYNLISTHDRDGAYVLVDHDEQDVVAADAPINNVYTPGQAPSSPLLRGAESRS